MSSLPALTTTRTVGGLLAGLGLALFPVHVWHASVMPPTLGGLLNGGIPLVIVLSVVLAGVGLGRSRLADSSVPRLGAWMAAGAATLLLVGGWIASHAPLQTFQMLWFVLMDVALVGLLVGLVAGVQAEAARMGRHRAERRGERLAFLNHTLRHHVLNGMQVVVGALDEVPDESLRAAARGRVDEMIATVEEVSTLTRATDREDLRAVDVTGPVAEALGVVTADGETSVSLDLQLPEGAGRVRADDSLAAVVRGLLTTAAQDTADGHLNVELAPEGGSMRLTVTPVDPAVWVDPCETRGDSPVGPCLVATEVARYGGEMGLDESSGRLSLTFPSA